MAEKEPYLREDEVKRIREILEAVPADDIASLHRMIEDRKALERFGVFSKALFAWVTAFGAMVGVIYAFFSYVSGSGAGK